MTSHTYVEFRDSQREAPAAKLVGAVPPDEPIEVSLYLKRRDTTEPIVSKDAPRDRRAAIEAHRTAQYANDIAAIKAFAAETGLTVSAVEPSRRLVKLVGPADKVQAAFRTKVAHYHDGKTVFRGRSGSLHLPENIAPLVDAVLGIDTRPAAEPRLVHLGETASLPGYLPNQIGRFYGFPAGTTGAGQTIALIELGGGFNDEDTKEAFKAMRLKPPTVIAISVDHAMNKPSPDNGADGEVALDIQVAGGVAPEATIAVYFAPNTDAGFVNAISAAVHDAAHHPSIISISWGSAEKNWSVQALKAMNTALQDAAELGVTVFVAAGDNLATDGIADGKVHVDFPASSPWSIGCGGTTITTDGNVISEERVWNDGTSGTGGGVSDVFPLPDYQRKAKVPQNVSSHVVGRGVPDVAGNAAPSTGYIVYVGGRSSVVGGTSAVAPLWAGLTALINSKASHPVGFFLPFLYENPNFFRLVTTGNNKPENSNLGYEAGSHWSACTGLGTPRGDALFTALIEQGGIA
ncbi:MAG TPA: S53 family peptidase [Alphaproteobacteria bacterium]|nr:S53 family peptidase [Alphaproteobacteria bacterium]